MKSGKDDEKIIGPMFPRLHVNDADKGGPRAPPRNKMALYEQLSIPSQRFSSGVLPLNSSNTSSLVPPGSCSQGVGTERNLFFPLHVPASVPTQLAEKFRACQPDAASVSGSLAQHEHIRKGGDEDDFRVPVYVQFGRGPCHSRTENGIDAEKLTPTSPINTSSSTKLQHISDRDPKQNSSSGLDSRQENGENLKMCVSSETNSVKSVTNVATREKIHGAVKEVNASPNRDRGAGSRLNNNDACLEQESRVRLQRDDPALESLRDIDKGTFRQLKSNCCSREDRSSPDELDNDGEYCRNKTYGSQLGDGDKSDDVSETSMVDSMSDLDVSPDDVVGIIGQRHFWKARRAIINQQRVFAVQVFELHRLIKVQQLIAGSPHLLLEDSAYLGKPSLKSSPTKKLPLEYVVKPLPHAVKYKDDSEKASQKLECSAENAVGKASLPSGKNGSQQYPVNRPVPSVAPDTKMGPWCYHQSPGHQWLVPVMSPSEGLIYKPYPAPGFMGSVCRGCGPFGPTGMTGNFMSPAYGVPAPHSQGVAVLPGAPPVGHCYFPPYGMPVMNPTISGSAVEQMNQFPGPGSHGHTGNLSGGGANFSMQQQSSCNLPIQKSGTVPQVMKCQPCKDTEVQGSRASSPAERMPGDVMGNVAEGKDALPLFPMAPLVPDEGPQPLDMDQPTRVIKVVPHNPRSATESAARIFQSIQEERKQYDSI